KNSYSDLGINLCTHPLRLWQATTSSSTKYKRQAEVLISSPSLGGGAKCGDQPVSFDLSHWSKRAYAGLRDGSSQTTSPAVLIKLSLRVSSGLSEIASPD